MFTAGQIFRLTSDIVAIETFKDRTRVVIVPAGNTVCVVKHPNIDDDRMTDVSWEGHPFVLFGQDLIHRADEVKAITTEPTRVFSGGAG